MDDKKTKKPQGLSAIIKVKVTPEAVDLGEGAKLHGLRADTKCGDEKSSEFIPDEIED